MYQSEMHPASQTAKTMNVARVLKVMEVFCGCVRAVESVLSVICFKNNMKQCYWSVNGIPDSRLIAP